MKLNQIYQGDTLGTLKIWPSDFVDTIITSPPYWGLRDYGVEGQIGLESTLDEYLNKLLAITEELKRVLKPTGVMFWNHGDCYSTHAKGQKRSLEDNDKSKADAYRRRGYGKGSGLPDKCLVLQNYRLILRMIDRGWILRNTIVWWKPNAMPSSVKDRFSNSHEPVFMLVKKKKYWFDLDSVRVAHKKSSLKRDSYGYKESPMKGRYTVPWEKREGTESQEFCNPAGKNPGDAWKIPTHPFPEAHFATFPEKLVLPMIKSSCPERICKKCGKARVRIIEKPDMSQRPKRGSMAKTKEDKHLGFKDRSAGQKYQEWRNKNPDKTIGWTDCGCNAGWGSGIVLDPFMGSGTVAVVANRLNRDWLGIELSEEYIKIAKERIKNNPKPMI